MPRLSLVLLFLLVFTWTVGAPTIPLKAQQFHPISLPLQFRDSLLFIPVMVHGQGPYLFAIDTGSSATVSVDVNLAKQLSLLPTGTTLLDDSTGRNTQVHPTTQINVISIGTKEFRNLTASIINLNDKKSAPRLDGMLGFRLFEDHLLTLDFPGKRFYLEQGNLSKTDGKMILPMKRIQSLPAVEISIQTVKVDALIDTGNLARRLVIAAPLARTLIYTSYEGTVVSARSFCNDYKFSEAQLKSNIAIGNYHFSSPVILWSPDYIYNNLGSVFLKDFVITFDQKKNLVKISYEYHPQAASAG